MATPASPDGNADSIRCRRAAGVPPQMVELDSLSKFMLWELHAIYGRREHDPDSFSPYEMRNAVLSEEREEELALLVHAHWQEDAQDKGRTAVTWVTLEELVRSLRDCELSVLDHYLQMNPSEKWVRARNDFRERYPEPVDDE